jgi:hypothetical protein
MMKVSQGLMLSSMLAFVLAFSGCPAEEETDGTENGGGSSVTSNDNGGGDNGHDEGGHSHVEDLPHDGVLIEFGSDYHGEFVHDEDSVTIYILDANASDQVAIAAEMITLNLVPADGDPTQYELNADPDEGDQDGKSSRFTSDEAGLVEALEAEGRTARVTVVVDDTPYNGEIPEDHGHSHD